MKRVAVLRGGPSEEYDVSMLTGKAVLEALQSSDYYQPKDIVITKKGEWLDSGFARSPENILDTIDIAFVALHGAYGEDGQIQRVLQRKGIPFTGSQALPSAIAFNKDLTKQTLRSHGVKMPRHRRYSRTELDQLDEEIPHLFNEVGSELFLKPLSSGSSHGARHIHKPEILKIALSELLELYDEVMIEEYIRGKEATVAVLENFRDQAIYSLPVIEVVPPASDGFYNYANKYNGTTDHICPGRFSYGEKSLLEETASLVHRAIGCRHYSRSDFIVKDGEVYFLEINTLPGLTPHSNLPIPASAVGLEFKDLIRHLIETARL